MIRVRAQNLSSAPAIRHGFFGREGGVSSGLYASLNCGPGSRDDPAAVAENRRRAVATLSPSARLVTLGQIHSAQVHVVGPDWDGQKAGDGLVTATPGVALGILTADCAPVLLADAGAGVIGAAHAGWKGALGGVLEATIRAMESLGARARNIAAAIGPAISQAHYEVGAEFQAHFAATDPGSERFFMAQEDRFRFDLPAYVAARLAAAGLGSVEASDQCTYPQDNGFFSFRRATHRGEPDYGREISAIVIDG